MSITINHFDHLVLTVTNLEKTIQFYTEVLGMERVIFGNGRYALAFGAHKINLHQAGREFEPKAHHPTAGSADICLIVQQPLTEVLAHLSACQVPVVEGPVPRTGASGPIVSVYIRDPDQNLIELSNYVNQ